MTKSDIASALEQIDRLIVKAEAHRQSGNLLDAAKFAVKADDLLRSWQQKNPDSKLIGTMAQKKEQCRNRILHDMIKRIH